jgi:demethylmenaquinone methyltransferase/2-methoxy-6-polyprenyl-1,4-benzoquinol methylase
MTGGEREEVLPTAGRPEVPAVRAMFGGIARRYDLLNSVLSMGEDRRWRRRAAQLTRLTRGGRALDVCTGTGALARLLWRRVGPSGSVLGVDITEEMLSLAARAVPEVEFRFGDALQLPAPDRAFDAVTMAFGLRNIADHQGALREVWRVLRPGGRVVILEFSTPRAFMRPLYGQYSRLVIPGMARLLLGRTGAYQYLTSSISAFPGPDVVAGWLRDAGFERVGYERMTLGIVALHSGRRPG